MESGKLSEKPENEPRRNPYAITLDGMIRDVRCIFRNISDEDRLSAINEIMEGYCKNCGCETQGTCHCTNDE